MRTVSVSTTLQGSGDGRQKWTQAGVQSFTVHRDIAELVELLLKETQRRGYKLVRGWCWSYSNRAISGTSSPSNHSWGLAVDLNAPANPYTSHRVTDMPDWMPALWAEYGFAWGGNYSGEQDSMHYEFMGTPADAQGALAAARRELLNDTGNEAKDLIDDMADNEAKVKALIADAVKPLSEGIEKIREDNKQIREDNQEIKGRTFWIREALELPHPHNDKSNKMPVDQYTVPGQLAKVNARLETQDKAIEALADGMDKILTELRKVTKK